MRNFGTLITNEWIKLYKKKSFYVYFAIMALFIGICTYFVNRYPMESINSALDFAAMFGSSMTGAGQILPMVAIIAIANIVPSEFRMGTIKLLLIRAQSRTKILASKYAVTLLFSIALIAATLAMSLLAGVLLFGFGGDAAVWSQIGENIVYMTVYTIIFVTLTFMVGVLTKSSGATVGIAMFCIMLGGIFTMLLARYSFIKFILFPSADLSVYQNGGTMPQGMTLSFSIAVIAVYLIVFLLASFFTFRKRDVS